jgi:hypothetical protein
MFFTNIKIFGRRKIRSGYGWYRINYIRAERADTLITWISGIFPVMNQSLLTRVFFGMEAGIIPGCVTTITILPNDMLASPIPSVGQRANR